MDAAKVLLAAGAIAACSPPPADLPCNEAGTAEIVLGYGDPSNPETFRVLHDGDSVALTPGNQGGQHMWLQTRARGIVPDRPRVQYRISRVDGTIAIGLSQYQGSRWSAVGSDATQFRSQTQPATIDDEQYCAVLAGAEVRVRATVDDRVGHCGVAEVRLRVDGWSSEAAPADRAARETCCRDLTNQRCYPNGPPDVVMTDATAE